MRTLTVAALLLSCGMFEARGQETGAADLRVTFLHTSDEHSTLVPIPFGDYQAGALGGTRGGFARLATVVRAIRSRKDALGEPLLLTSAGDNFTGSPFAWLALEGQAPELGLMATLGYDVVTFGNHEFDYGSDRLAEYLGAAGFPAAAERTSIVATNTVIPAGHPLGERGVRRTHLVTLSNGLRVGFIGLLGEGAARFAQAAPPVSFSRAVEAARSAEADLRAAGADVVVAITHSGVAEDQALARAVPGIQVILGGHNHRLLAEPLIEGSTVIVHPGVNLAQVIQLDVAFDRDTRSVRVVGHLVHPLDDSVAEAPDVAARIAEYRRRLEARIAELTNGRFTALDQRVARGEATVAAGASTETPLGNFVTDAMRWSVARETGRPVDFAFQSSGQIRASVVPSTAAERRGDIVFYDLANAVGLGSGPDGSPGYPLIGAWLTGDEVRRVLEVSVLLSQMLGPSYYLQVSGLRARYDPSRAVWARIPGRGTPIPSGRAVLSLEQTRAGSTTAIPRGDTTLYHVVADLYVASFLPVVGRLVPSLGIIAKDSNGAPLADLEHAVLRTGAGDPLTVWQAVMGFAMELPPGPDGIPRVPGYYATTSGRLTEARGIPLWLLPALVVAALAAVTTWAVRRRRR